MEINDENKKENNIKKQDKNTKEDINSELKEEVKVNEEESIHEEENKQINKTRKRKILIICFITLTILLIILLSCTIFSLLNINNAKIIKGVTINQINIENLTKEEALQKLKENIEARKEKEVSIKSENFEYSIKLSQMEVDYKIEDALEKAYNIGRDENIFENNFKILKSMIKGENINIEYSYNEELLKKTINDISVKIPNAVEEANYYIEDEVLHIVRGKKR